MARATTQIGQLTQGGRGGRRRSYSAVGRETKLTPELSKRICDVVRAGNYVSVAARYCGVGERTLAEWIARGKGDDARLPSRPIYVQFLHDLEAAEAGSEVTAVLHWRAAMPKDWHSSERWLRTRIPERWGDKDDATARQVAMAGVQINIGGQSGTDKGLRNDEAPIADILEDNPHLIGNVMQLLDQLLPVEQQNVLSSAESPANGNETAQEAVYDTVNDVWVPKDDEMA